MLSSELKNSDLSSNSVLMNSVIKCDQAKDEKREQWRQQIKNLNQRHRDSIDRLNSRSRSREPTPPGRENPGTSS